MIVDLPAPFQQALETIVGELTARDDVVGILFFGSAARGEAQSGSDLDLYAITAQDARGHLGRPMCADAGFPGSLAVQVADRVLQGLGGRLEAYDTPPQS